MSTTIKRQITAVETALKAAVETAKKMTDEEHGLKILLEKIRKLYFRYGIAGEIEITKGSTMASSLSCEVDGTSGEYFQDFEPEVKVNIIMDAIAAGVIRILVMGVDKMLNDLIHRSKQYWDKSYKDDMTLAGTFSFSDPEGIFTTEINCSATIKSMHDHIFRENEFELTYGFPVNRPKSIEMLKEV